MVARANQLETTDSGDSRASKATPAPLVSLQDLRNLRSDDHSAALQGMVKSGALPDFHLDSAADGGRSDVARLRTAGARRAANKDAEDAEPIDPMPTRSRTHGEPHAATGQHAVHQFHQNADGSQTVEVQRHDTLWRIARETLNSQHKDDPTYHASNRDVANAVKLIAQSNHLKNADVIHPGEQITIPKELAPKSGDHGGAGDQDPRHGQAQHRLQRPPSTEANHDRTQPPPAEAKPHQDRTRPPGDRTDNPEERKRQEDAERARAQVDRLVDVRGASPEFAAKVKGDLLNMPPEVRDKLEQNHYKVIAARTMDDYDPQFAHQHPRGWPPGTTFENCEGVQRAERHEIIVTEMTHNQSTGELERVNEERMHGTLKHETGHALDAAMGDYVNSDAFKKAYERDVANMTPAEREQFGYLLQAGQPGRQETFADVFAAMNGHSSVPGNTENTLQKWPNVARAIDDRLRQLHEQGN